MKLGSKAALAVALIWALLAAPTARGEEPEQLARRVQAAYAKIENIVSDYVRISRFVAAGPNLARTVKARGRLIWGQPWRLHLEQFTPRNELIISDGRDAWWVRPKRKRVDLYAVSSFTPGLRALLRALSGLSRLEKSFAVVAPAPEEAGVMPSALCLVLKPRKSRADLKRLVLWFHPGRLILAGFRIISLVGDITDYRFSGQKLNQKLPPDLFRYAAPAGFRLVDHRPLKPRKP